MPQCIYSNTTHGMKSRCKLLYEMLLSALKKANSIHPSGFAESVTKNSRSSLPKPKTFQQEKYQLWIELPQKLKPSRHASKSDEIIITTLPTNWTGSPVQKHPKTSFCGGFKCVIQRGIIFPRYTALPMYATLHVYSMYAVHTNFIGIESYAVYMPVPKTSVQKILRNMHFFEFTSLNKHTAVTESIWWWNPTWIQPREEIKTQNYTPPSKCHCFLTSCLLKNLHPSFSNIKKTTSYCRPAISDCNPL